jgi:uncharacterized protein (UPF0254 family)
MGQFDFEYFKQINNTDDVPEGSINLYFTEERVSTNVNVELNTIHRGLTNNPHQVTASQVGINSTDDVLEGVANLYFTEARVSNNSDVQANTIHRGLTDNPHAVTASQVGLNTTDDLSEGGSNLYFTEARVSANIDVTQNSLHRISTDNPHSVTPEQIGLSNTDNLPEGGANLYYTDVRVSNNTSVTLNTQHRGLTNNPHNVTAAQIGLGDTDSLPEGAVNLYFTDARVSNNVSVQANTIHRGLTNNPHNVTLGQLGLTSTDDLSEGSINLYYTDLRVSNNSSVSQNTAHRLSTNNPHGVTAAQVGINSSDDVVEGATNLYYTDARVSANPDVSANTAHRVSFNNPHNVTLTQLGLTDTDDLAEGITNLYYTDARVSANPSVQANTIHRGLANNPHNVTAAQVGLSSTDDLAEGVINLYYTEARVSANSDVSANTAHRFSTNNPHNVTLGQLGLSTTDDLPEGSINLYFTESRVSNNADVSANSAHRVSTNNPHNVTPAQVGNTVAQWNASEIVGVPVVGLPSANTGLAYSLLTNELQFKSYVSGASNAGSAGVGVFDSYLNTDLEFRNLNPTSSRITLTLDSLNKNIDVDADESAFDLNAIGGVLGIGKGGTGQTNKTAAFDALAPTASRGDIIASNGTNNIAFGAGVNGQILSADNTQPSGLAWVSAGAGTITNAANVGVSGVGLFDSVNVDVLEFRNIAAATAKVTVTLDSFDKVVNIDVDPAQIDINDLTNTLNIAKGGTGATTKLDAFNNLSPMALAGDLIAYDGVDNIAVTVGADGEALIADSLAPVGFSWQTTVNAVANIGVGGVGVFDNLNAGTAELRNIAPASAKITVVLDAPNNQVNLDVSESSLTLDNLGGTLSISKGGTGQTTQTAAFDALSPSSAKGDLIVNNGSNDVAQTVGANNEILVADSTAATGIRWDTVDSLPVSVGEMYFNNNATDTAITTINTPVKITATYVSGELANFTHTGGTLTYTGAATRIFKVDCKLCYTINAGTGGDYTIIIYKNGAAVSKSRNTQEVFTSEINSTSAQAAISLTTSDTIEVYIENNSNTDDIAVVNFNAIVY